ncbi:hypothetical protein LYNGBM3L_32870 [Moorena producens 3L]|uniref:Uncharacterized protein n=1 Tax=Moorena producens 3L TaxID=489825 RepID=F4XUF6_9CYAN|nr:hypothetical protein LYNGBM3L_32870 [Moorena producens 3L]
MQRGQKQLTKAEGATGQLESL